MHELGRVLRPGGHLVIYQLPRRYAWQQALVLVRRFHLGYAHPRRYSAAEIGSILQQAGYSVIDVRRANLIPKNPTSMPHSLRAAYSRLSRTLIALDGIVCKLPGLNQLAGALEVSAAVPGSPSTHLPGAPRRLMLRLQVRGAHLGDNERRIDRHDVGGFLLLDHRERRRFFPPVVGDEAVPIGDRHIDMVKSFAEHVRHQP